VSELEESFDRAMRANGEKILSLALRLTSRRDLADDLTQDTFVKAYEHWPDFRGRSDPGTWFYRICVNLWKNRLRDERRKPLGHGISLEGPEGLGPGEFLADQEPTPDESLDAAARQSQLTEALALLESKDRAILVMREIDDLSYEEIAEMLEIPLGTVKSRLARCREKLADLYRKTDA
jgi:RNA polymerase sigma-70 factor, ECF subfamily